MLLLFLVLLTAYVFEYINGFHDTANAIATVVSTKVLTPRQAVVWAAVWNMVGALAGTAVASTIGKGLVDTSYVTPSTVLAALIGAVIWNVLTWWLGLPSSSSHALVGGLCGAALATAHGRWSVLVWSISEKGKSGGLWPQVILPMISSPVFGFIIGGILMFLLLFALQRARPMLVGKIFGKAQLLSAAFMGFGHGNNDAQKTMGVITLALVTATKEGLLDHLPPSLHFLRISTFAVPYWVIISCALTMAAGTAAGGWRIIRTMGHKMVKLQPIHGFAAETTAGVIIHFATILGIPISTTHVISAAIMGVGATERFSAVKWGVVERIVWAWVLTLPVSAVLGYLAFKLINIGG